jgi:predicted DNA-binding protein
VWKAQKTKILLLRDALEPNALDIEDNKLKQLVEELAKDGAQTIHTRMATPHRDFQTLALLATIAEIPVVAQVFGVTLPIPRRDGNTALWKAQQTKILLLRDALEPNALDIEDNKLKQLVEELAKDGAHNIHTRVNTSPHRNFQTLALLATIAEIPMVVAQVFGVTLPIPRRDGNTANHFEATCSKYCWKLTTLFVKYIYDKTIISFPEKSCFLQSSKLW